MDNLKESTLKDFGCKTPNVNKTIFWDRFGNLSTPNYRNIPVSKTNDAIKVTGIPIENVCGVKELEIVSNFNRNNASSDTTKSGLNPSNTHSKRLKRSPNVVVKKPPNTHQHQADLAPALPDRQNSLSEPTLAATKDRGDSAVFHKDVPKEDASTVKPDFKPCLSDGKSLSPKKQPVKGLLYIKNAGDVYKSEIEAKKLQVYERDIFKNFPRLFTSKNLSNKNTQMKQVQEDGKGDFDVAIFLSGLLSAVQKHQKQDLKDFERAQREECKDQDNITKRKKKFRVSTPCRRSCQIANQSHTSPRKLRQAKKCDRGTSSHYKTRLSYQINKPNIPLDLSGDDSDEEYELKESGNIVSKRKSQEILDNNSIDVKHVEKTGDSGRLSGKSRKSGKSAASSRTRITSQQSILSHYSDGSEYHKPKINEDEMWENFLLIFKSYASTSRHSAGVIPRKISTEWMINAGVVNGIITQKQADEAFRSAAGAKITMNAQDYKEFLISLSLKLKLSYYQIYRQMCGM